MEGLKFRYGFLKISLKKKMVVENIFSLHSPFLLPISMNNFLFLLYPITGPDLHLRYRVLAKKKGGGGIILPLIEDSFQIPVRNQKRRYVQVLVYPSGPSFSTALSGSLRPPQTFYHPRRERRFAGHFFFLFSFHCQGPSSHDNTTLMKFTFRAL